MNHTYKITIVLVVLLCMCSCKKFLDVVPDNTATVDKAFRVRNEAKRFLYTCYHYLPFYHDNVAHSPFTFSSSEEFIETPKKQSVAENQVLMNSQKVVDPYFNYWQGTNVGFDLYEAIRKCNTFLENIYTVGNMTIAEKNKWAAEVKFLKAYYYFYLIRMYGPVRLFKKNTSLSASKEEVDQPRAPVDSCFKYVETLLNEVIHTPELPIRVENENKNLGRISKSIAYAMKAKVEVTAASPIFNGSNNYAGFKNVNGDNPFSTKKSTAKWDSAVVASKEAIAYLSSHNYRLYKYQSSVTNSDISDSTKQKLSIRNSFAGHDPGSNVIWYYTGKANYHRLQANSLPRGLNPKNLSNGEALPLYAPPLRIINIFYSNHGVPIDEDKSRNYQDRYQLQKVGSDERFYMKEGYTTAKLNLHREPRFYADLGFDGSIYYGNGIYSGGPDKYHFLQMKAGQVNAIHTHEDQFYSMTGYLLKKTLNYQTELDNTGYGATYNYYDYPIIRLADLYLLYAEAKNEADGPGPQVYEYLNKVRAHAGLPTVQEAWDNWSTNPGQYQSKSGLREIIHRERTIELMFEGQRYWDIRRWGEISKLNGGPIQGWNIDYSEPEDYYKPRSIFTPHYSLKEYLSPLSENVLNSNPKLTQNPGW